MHRIRLSSSGPPIQVLELADAALGLRGAIFVDLNTLVETVQQNGSILAPFATVTQAIAALNEGETNREIFIALGDYSSEPPLTLLPNRVYILTGSIRGITFASLPPLHWTVGGDLTSLLVLRRCTVGLLNIFDDSVPATEAVLSYEDCECRGINGATTVSPVTILMAGTIGAFDAEINHITVTATVRLAAINVQFGLFYANNVAFQDTCPSVQVAAFLASNCSFEQNVFITTDVEMRGCIWRDPGNLLTFTGSPGIAYLDLRTQNNFNVGQVTLVNGEYVATDQVYDPSSTIPIPEGATTGQTTFATQTTLVGASYRIPTFEIATHINIVASTVSAPTTFVVALYQGRGGQTTTPVRRVGQGSLLIPATPAAYSIPLDVPCRLVPGVVFILYGRIAGGGNLSVRSYTTPTVDLLNDLTTTPQNAHPTAFTTTLPSAAPPITFDPRIVGGIVTPAGASNLTLLTRMSVP